jgi:hypothetical protein
LNAKAETKEPESGAKHFILLSEGRTPSTCDGFRGSGRSTVLSNVGWTKTPKMRRH